MLKIRCFNNKKASTLFTNAISIFVETFQVIPCCSRLYSTSNIGELINKRIGKIIFQRSFGTSGQKNLYEILEVSQNATQTELKSAFYKLSKRYHPDVSGSSDASNKKFVEISNAYETLKDEQKRREYDRQLRFGTSQERPNTGRETGQPSTWSTDFHPRPPFKNQEWEKEWKWQFGATSDRQRRRPFSPFDDIFGGPPPSGSSPFQRWQWDQEQKRRQWAEWEWGEEIERRKREEKELNEVGILLLKFALDIPCFLRSVKTSEDTKTQDWVKDEFDRLMWFTCNGFWFLI
uniref:J domain-containing protein n=1 Tax=Meloidogyne enterolobii TaxID=390850 RepID=A0A6V7U328_MELEN|nr:unnamed protein product [Meloidogyne enterolobii]